MHESSMARMQWFAEEYIHTRKNISVLDVGSYNVNGCYRDIFESRECRYQGLDMEYGPNVDIVPKHIYHWEEIRSDSYDAVVSGQALEHIEYFWITFGEIVRVTKQGGLICIIAPNGFKEHRYPVDCWRFFTDGMIALARYYNLEILNAHTNCAPSIDLHAWFSEDMADSMLVARKGYSGKAKEIDLKEHVCIPADHKKTSNNFVSYKDYKKREREISNKEIERTNNCIDGSNKKNLLMRIKAKTKALIQKMRKGRRR